MRKYSLAHIDLKLTQLLIVLTVFISFLYFPINELILHLNIRENATIENYKVVSTNISIGKGVSYSLIGISNNDRVIVKTGICYRIKINDIVGLYKYKQVAILEIALIPQLIFNSLLAGAVLLFVVHLAQKQDLIGKIKKSNSNK